MPETFPESAKDVQNHWQRTPLRTHGDLNAEAVFAAVGHALTAWEHVESSIADLFMIFTECKDTNSYRAVRRAFGATEFNSGRKKALEAAAEIYFDSYWPFAKRSFARLIDHINYGSERRNDIAHGQVITLTVTEASDGASSKASSSEFRGSLLLPPDYNTGRTFASPDPADTDPMAIFRAVYRYNSEDIRAFAGKFYGLQRRIWDYARSVAKTEKGFPEPFMLAYLEYRKSHHKER